MENIIRQLNDFFIRKFSMHPEVVSIFVVGSMYDLKNYVFRKNNDYDIRLLVTEVTPSLLQYAEEMQKDFIRLVKKEDIYIGYSNLVGPVNHNLSNAKTNLLIHLIIHRIQDLTDFLPLTHQYCYRKNHHTLWGKDYLTDLASQFAPEYLIDCHEGIKYCVDMLQRKVYKYLYWKTVSETEAVFEYREDPLPYDLQHESVFYSLKNVINNLYNSCISIRGVTGVTLEDYCQWLCRGNEEYLALTTAVLTRNDTALDQYPDLETMFGATIDLLLYLQDRIEKGQVEKGSENP